MSENTIISGWSIKLGDFKSDAEYDKKYKSDIKNRKRIRLISAFISGMVCLFIILLTLNLFSNI